MVKTLLSTHTNTHVRTRTNTPQQIYYWQLRVQYHSMNTVRMQFYRYIDTPTSLGTLGSPDYTPTWYTRVPCEGSIPVVRGRSALLPDHYSSSD